MGTVQELAKKWWAVVGLIICAVLWANSANQLANTKPALDSLAVTVAVVESLSTANQELNSRSAQLASAIQSVQAAHARDQRRTQRTTDSLLAQIRETVPVEVQPVVDSLTAKIERERLDFTRQIESAARLDTLRLSDIAQKDVAIDSLVRLNLRTAADYEEVLKRRRPNIFTTIKQALPYVAAGIVLGKVIE